ncbi:Carboxypeptidase G2 precursor [Caulifigura coniformis]|uniref:Carboxypeptidase G2 n=1 Tax=Caulifigura coniformis TaxID=2527983 RepID=A0A517SDW6_9PLAN|nr:M20/M25/M40 family metallo-hydrolase [Caulifigura coniformis]QDT54322.1 Carboxypeptidase G2 precursor [Caulifigura coniformis]
MARAKTSENKAAIDLVLELLSISGKSGEEKGVADFLVKKLKGAGVPDSAISFDTAHKESPIGGQVGNLIVKLPGTITGKRRLLMAHMDTVPLCVGAKPVRKGNKIVSADPATALGGDDRAGVAVVLHTALTLLEQSIPHPPITLFFAVQEEIGLVGARYVNTKKLGDPKMCFNWDGGNSGLVTIGATGAFNLDITVHGLASHAGAHPEDGISAIAVAGAAIADLQANGWHGLVEKGKKSGTSNIGVIQGGAATNVVTDRVDLQAECRSHDAAFRKKIVEAFVAAFAKASKSLKNAAGKNGSVEFEIQHKYESFKLAMSEPTVIAAMEAIEKCGLEPAAKVSNGGLDANWMSDHGFLTVTLGCGQDGIHTTSESLDLEHFQHACRIAMELATTV